MFNEEQALACYPSRKEVDNWVNSLWKKVESTPVEAVLDNAFAMYSVQVLNLYANHVLMRFKIPGQPDFCGIYYQPISGPKPLMVFLPGYGGEMNITSTIAADDYAVLSLCPNGYWTPEGIPGEKREGDNWPVLPDTIRTKGNGGYFDWMLQAALAVKWAWQQTDYVLPNRVSFFGTSQGGGMAILMGSLFMGHGTKCVMSDEPFLTNYPVAKFTGAYNVLEKVYSEVKEEDYWHYLGFVDTISHAERLTVPVLVTSGGKDVLCPHYTINKLYDLLPQTKARMFLHDRGHGHNNEFGRMALAWASMYA